MSIFLTINNTGPPIPTFVERKISNSQPGDVADSNIMVSFTGISNTRFVIGMANIVDHIYCILAKTFIISFGGFRNVFKLITLTTSFETPTAIFTFSGLTDEQRNVLRGFGLSQDPSSNNTFTGSPNAKDLGLIYNMGLVDSKFVGGMVPADGYLAYIYAMKGMQAFSNLSRKMVAMEGTFAFDQLSDSLVDGVDVNVRRTAIGAEYVKCKLKAAGIFLHTMVGKIAEVIYPSDGTGNLTPSFIRPSTISSWGTEKNYLFGYFHGMNTPNRDKAYTVFSRLFMKGLSDTPEGAARITQKLRAGFRRLAPTRAGMAIAHAYMGIEMALDSQCGIAFLIESGVYHGFILSGDAIIVYRGQVVKELGSAALIAAVQDLDRKDRVLTDIVAILNSPVNDGGMPAYSFSKEQVNVSRKFLQAFSTIRHEFLTTQLFTENLPKLVDKMTWGDNFDTPSQAKILDFLRYVQTGEEEHISKYPAYLANSYYQHTSRVSVGLGIFGPKALSCSYGSNQDKQFSIPRDLATVDPNLEMVDGKRSLRYLPFALVPIQTAETQWNTLFRTGSIRIPNGRGKKDEFTDMKRVFIQIGGNPAFAQIYSLIKEHSISVRMSISDGHRKRQIDDEDIGEAPSRKKSKKDNENVAMDL